MVMSHERWYTWSWFELRRYTLLTAYGQHFVLSSARAVTTVHGRYQRLVQSSQVWKLEP